MKINDVYTAYVSWGKSGKRRPILILKFSNGKITFFKITSKYQNKSTAIKRMYYPIQDLAAAGLIKQSYVDTINSATLSISKVKLKKIGSLSDKDIYELARFIKNNSVKH